MTLTSFPFLIFAAVTVLLYYLLPKRAQWVVLLTASILFYAAAGGWYLPFILVTILTELHDDVDFTTETGLIENGILNSLDIVSIITEVSDRFDVTIPAEEIMPENFDSAEALWALICRLDED